MRASRSGAAEGAAAGTERPASAPPPTAGIEAGYIGALGGYLDQPVAEETLIQGHGVGDVRRVGKLDVGVALGLARPAVAEDGDAVDGATGLKVCLQLFGRGAIVDVADVDGAGISLGRVAN